MRTRHTREREERGGGRRAQGRELSMTLTRMQTRERGVSGVREGTGGDTRVEWDGETGVDLVVFSRRISHVAS